MPPDAVVRSNDCPGAIIRAPFVVVTTYNGKFKWNQAYLKSERKEITYLIDRCYVAIEHTWVTDRGAAPDAVKLPVPLDPSEVSDPSS